MKRWIRGAALVAALACVATITAQSPSGGTGTTLKWNFAQDAILPYEIATKTKQAIKVLGQEIKQDLEVVTVTSYKVAQRSMEGVVTLDQKIDSVKVTVAGGVVPGLLQQLQGATFRLTLSPKFEVTKFEGYEELLRRLAGEDANARRVVQSMISEESLRHTAEEAFAFVPGKAVKPGDKWERKLEVPLGPLGQLNLTNAYTLDEPENVQGKTLQKISVKPSVTYTLTKADAAVLPYQIVKGDLKVEDAAGTLLFDAVAGRLVRSSMHMKLKGALTIQLNNMESPLELEQEQNVEIKALEVAKKD
jgi:hypothetical protein